MPYRTFSGKHERMRQWGNVLPPQLYRTFHEESKTLCAFMNTENQPKYREVEGVKILPRNAFQAIGAPDLAMDLTLNRVDRHLSWSTVKGPSSYISAFNRLGEYVLNPHRTELTFVRLGHSPRKVPHEQKYQDWSSYFYCSH